MTNLLEQDGEVNDVIERLQSPDPQVRRVAVLELADEATDDTAHFLARALRDDDATVREEAANALSGVEEPEAVAALLAALEDESPRVRAAAAAAIEEVKNPTLGPLLLGALEKAEPFVKASVLRALRGLRLRESLMPALQALIEPDRRIRRAAASVLGYLQARQALSALIDRVKNDEDPEVRRIAVGAVTFSTH